MNSVAWIKLKEWIATSKTNFGRTQLLEKMRELEFETIKDYERAKVNLQKTELQPFKSVQIE